MSPPVRILVVDDDAPIRATLSRFLSERGFEVDTAPDGQAGLDALQADTPDVVFLDMDMPEVSGLDVLRHIQNKDIDIHVIAISGHPLAEELLGPDCLRLGAAEFFAKPFDLDEIGERLDEMFGPSEP